MMPKRSNNRRPRKNGNGGNSTRGGATSAPMMGGMASAKQDTQISPMDLTLRPPSRTFNARPPRNLLSQIHWLRGQGQIDFATSTTLTTQLATTFFLNQVPFASEVASLFDQYAMAEVAWSVSNISDAGVATLSIHSVIDFDGQSFLTPPTSITTLDQYSTCVTSILGVGKSVVRVVRPCVESTLYTGGTGGYATERLWIDSGNTNVPHYGILAVADVTPGGSVNGRVTYTYLVACRNNN
jgi:hypothetical protein